MEKRREDTYTCARSSPPSLSRVLLARSLSLGAEVVRDGLVRCAQAGLPAGDPNLAVNTRMRHTDFAINQLVVDDLVECALT